MSRPASLLAAASVSVVVALVAAACTVDPFCREGDVGCSADPCANLLRDGDETDVDCGGSCSPCATGASCVGRGDCAAGRCNDGACCEPPCVAWTRRFGGATTERASKAVVLGDGSVVIAGVFEGTLELGADRLVSEGETDLFVAAFAPGGELRWSRRFGGAGGEAQPRLGLAPDGHLWFAGGFASAALDTGAGVLQNSGPFSDIFIVELDAEGRSLRARALSTNQMGGALVDIVGTGDGGLVLTGVLGGLDFGDGTVLAATFDPKLGNRFDVFLAKLGPDLERVWSRRFGDAQEDVPYVLRLDPQGDVVLMVGSVSATDFGGPPLARPGLTLARYAQKDGAHRWSRGYGANAAPVTLQVGAGGELFVAGDLVGEADLGTGKLRPKGSADAFLARFDSEGAPLWVVPVAGAIEAHAMGLVHRAEGGLVAALRFTGDVDLGHGIKAPVGVDSLLLVRLDDDGRFEWARNAGGIFLKVPVGLADLPHGHVLAFGGFAGTLELGGSGGRLLSAGSSDVFLGAMLP